MQVIHRNTYQLDSYQPVCDTTHPSDPQPSSCHTNLNLFDHSYYYILQAPAPAVVVVGNASSSSVQPFDQPFYVHFWCHYRWELFLFAYVALLLQCVSGCVCMCGCPKWPERRRTQGGMLPMAVEGGRSSARSQPSSALTSTGVQLMPTVPPRTGSTAVPLLPQGPAGLGQGRYSNAP